MLNPIEAYAECGRRAAIAVNQDDAGRALAERDHFQRMRDLEATREDMRAAERAYKEAYSAARNVPGMVPSIPRRARA